MANPYQGDDEDPFSGVRDTDGNVKQTGLARTAKLSPFGLAFDTARKAGNKTFEFKGKKYTTKMAKPKPKAASDTDTITKGATKLYNESDTGLKAGVMNPDQIAAAKALTMPNEESKFMDSSMRGEYGTMKKGGKVESKLMGKEGRGMAKATMQKVASKAVKGHESRMHKMKSGGTVSSASKRADGIAMKGKTRGKMV